MAAPSWQEYFDLGKAEAIYRRPDLTFGIGDITEMLMAGAGAMADHLTGYAARRFKMTYLDGARGEDLTTLAWDHWAVLRKAASPAAGVVTITRTLPDRVAGIIPAGFVVATLPNAAGEAIEFAIDTPVPWSLGETGSKDVTVTAVNVGPAGNVDVNKISRFSSIPFDDAFTVTNTDRTAGGDFEESDDDLKERVRALPNALRKGTIAAIEYGALTVASVKRATVVENLDQYNQKTGIVSLYVSDIDGGASPTMVSDVRAVLPDWEAAGIIVNVYGGIIQYETVTVALDVRAGIDTTALVVNVKNAIIARINKLKIGDKLQPTAIAAAAMGVDTTNILSVDVVAPPTTITPPANALIRIAGGIPGVV